MIKYFLEMLSSLRHPVMYILLENECFLSTNVFQWNICKKLLMMMRVGVIQREYIPPLNLVVLNLLMCVLWAWLAVGVYTMYMHVVYTI